MVYRTAYLLFAMMFLFAGCLLMGYPVKWWLLGWFTPPSGLVFLYAFAVLTLPYI